MLRPLRDSNKAWRETIILMSSWALDWVRSQWGRSLYSRRWWCGATNQLEIISSSSWRVTLSSHWTTTTIHLKMNKRNNRMGNNKGRINSTAAQIIIGLKIITITSTIPYHSSWTPHLNSPTSTPPSPNSSKTNKTYPTRMKSHKCY